MRGALSGVLTERALARRYIRETRRTSTLEEAPTYVSAIVDVLEGELVAGDDRQLSGRVWVHSTDVTRKAGSPMATRWWSAIAPMLSCWPSTSAPRCWSSPTAADPEAEVIERARERGTALVVSPLDSYVSGRMITPGRSLPGADGNRRL